MKIPRSKTTLSTLAAAVALALTPLAGTAFGQTTAATTPVGFITLSVPAATDANTPSNAALSIPLYGTAAFQSTIATVDSSTAFSFTGATFMTTPPQFTTVPYIVHIQTGNSVGRSFLILSNTATQVTLDTRGADLTSLVNVGDSVAIIQACTLGSVFGVSPTSVQTGPDANDADNIFLWDTAAATWDVYFNNGTNWLQSGKFATVENNTVIFPDEGIFVTRRATTGPLTFTLMGTVPSTTEATVLTGAGSTFFPNRFPIDVSLGSLGLETSANWTSGPDAADADDVYAWDTALNTWDVYYYNNSVNHWLKSGGFGTVYDTQNIPAGTAVFITRANASATALAQILPYKLN